MYYNYRAWVRRGARRRARAYEERIIDGSIEDALRHRLDTVLGALIGTLGGLVLGLPGLIFGPFVGAVTGEMLTHGEMQRATRAGFATWVGLIFGTLTKLALVFTMLGIFAFAWFV